MSSTTAYYEDEQLYERYAELAETVGVPPEDLSGSIWRSLAKSLNTTDRDVEAFFVDVVESMHADLVADEGDETSETDSTPDPVAEAVGSSSNPDDYTSGVEGGVSAYSGLSDAEVEELTSINDPSSDDPDDYTSGVDGSGGA